MKWRHTKSKSYLRGNIKSVLKDKSYKITVKNVNQLKDWNTKFIKPDNKLAVQ